MLANREGLFHAMPVDIGLGETNQNKLLQVVIQYRLFEELVNGEWIDCSADNLEISGYHVLEKKDHTLNTVTIEALKAALGWNGADPFWLQDNAQALADQPVQVKLVFEEYDGQKTLKVAFLNPHGSRGGAVPKADDTMRRAVGNRLGMKFRANAGGTSANPPRHAGKPAPAKPTAPKPAAPQTAAPKPAASPPSVPSVPSTPTAPAVPAASDEVIPPATMQQAWDVFVKSSPTAADGSLNQASVEHEWFRILAELFPGRQPDQLSDADWGVMLAKGPGMMLPF